MTLSQLIAKLEAVKAAHGGDIPVVQLAYGGSGRSFWAYEHIGKVSLEPLKECYCRRLNGLSPGRPCLVID